MKKEVRELIVSRLFKFACAYTWKADYFGEFDEVPNDTFKNFVDAPNIKNIWIHWAEGRCKELYAAAWYDEFCPMINTMYSNHKIELFGFLEIEIKTPCKGMSFYTIVPKERLEYNANNISIIADFCQEMFEMRGSKYFEQVWYCIESGKHQNRPNLHIHMLCEFKAMGSKFFLRDMKHKWKQYYPEDKYTINYDIEGNKGIHRVDCNTLEIQQDKVEYMDNELKGTHENFTDIGIRKYLRFEV